MARWENARTHGNWEGTGVAPDLAVPAADALRAAHRAALERLVADKPDSTRAATWREALQELAGPAPRP